MGSSLLALIESLFLLRTFFDGIEDGELDSNEIDKIYQKLLDILND